MSTSKEYKAIKNFIHNELSINKQVVVDIVKTELKSIVPEVLNNTYGTYGIKNIVEMVIRDIIAQDGGFCAGKDVRSAIKEKALAIFENEFELQFVSKNKKNEART